MGDEEEFIGAATFIDGDIGVGDTTGLVFFALEDNPELLFLFLPDLAAVSLPVPIPCTTDKCCIPMSESRNDAPQSWTRQWTFRCLQCIRRA